MQTKLFTFKTCKKCRDAVEVQDFRVRNKTTGTRRKECYRCELQDRKEYRANNRLKVSAYNKSYYKKKKLGINQ